jgi:hypothetical protein
VSTSPIPSTFMCHSIISITLPFTVTALPHPHNYAPWYNPHIYLYSPFYYTRYSIEHHVYAPDDLFRLRPPRHNYHPT